MKLHFVFSFSRGKNYHIEGGGGDKKTHSPKITQLTYVNIMF